MGKVSRFFIFFSFVFINIVWDIVVFRILGVSIVFFDFLGLS